MKTPEPIRYFVVDAFTDRPFAGNPAAVVPLSEWRDDSFLQNVAMEMNLSETAFLVANDQGFDLRWFSLLKCSGIAPKTGLAPIRTIGSCPIFVIQGAVCRMATRQNS